MSPRSRLSLLLSLNLALAALGVFGLARISRHRGNIRGEATLIEAYGATGLRERALGVLERIRGARR